jgi:hypothetical protein
MTQTEMEQKHMKERISFERRKEKALKQLWQEQAAVLSIFTEGEKIPFATQQRLNEETTKLKREWGEEGPHYKTLLQKQKKEREKYLGKTEE